ncbi:hypothetical protein [Lacihabitans soyangensis]|uniref:YceI family protein n=1 Tax=Lacihabitans soyangensis TaxID=869394 RepID=A0AAE3KX31_9BACT|nr:hypothetical protein [Lacihabitans soyangensis]MCP9763975.1 hypothetical protein [Lacihabitans soyangensis]
MKNSIILILTLAFIGFLSCNNSGTESKSDTNEDLYFTFSIDGKEVSIPPEEVSTSYNTALKKPVFKVFAGEYGKINLLLATTEDVTKPSSTPSGSKNFDDEITQGSVSLQNYPEKNYTSNSFNTNFPASSIPVPDAIVITESKRFGDTHRIITGKINVKVFGGDATNDPKLKDHVIVGEFRVKHEFSDVKF